MQQYRRSGALFWLLSIAVLVGAMMAASLAQAQTTSVGPYYATPSWDQTLPSATRFIVLSNFASNAVLDRETGLVWEQSPASTLYTWYTARRACLNRDPSPRRGWRLPSLHELASLIDPTVAFPGPTLPAGHPFTLTSGTPGALVAGFWSATTDATFPDFAWSIDINRGLIGTFAKTTTNINAWCVRGGGLLSEY